MEEQAERDREEGHPEPEDEEEEREHEVMTAGSECTLLALQIHTVAFFLVGKLTTEERGKHFFTVFLKGSYIFLMIWLANISALKTVLVPFKLLDWGFGAEKLYMQAFGNSTCSTEFHS